MKLRKILRLQFGIVAVIVGLGITAIVNAARNSSGTMTFTASTTRPAVTGQPISATDFNVMMADIEVEVTDSLSRSNKGAMLGNLELVAGVDTPASPALTWSGDTDSGWYRVAADSLACSVGGVRVLGVSALGINILGTVTATAVAANTDGVDAFGTGTGHGVYTQGGSGGYGVRASGGTGSNLAGVYGGGDGTGEGGTFIPGTATTAGTERAAIVATAGGVSIAHTDLLSTTGVTNGLYESSIPKAWGLITTVAGTPATVSAGFNITSVTCATNVLTVNIADDMASTTYAVTCNALNAGGIGHICSTHTRAVGSFVIQARDDAGGTLNLCTAGHEVNFVVFGAQ